MGLFIGSSVHTLRAIARQSPSSSRGAAVGVEQAQARRRPQRRATFASTCATRLRRTRACAPRRATDLLYREAKAGLAAPGEAEPPRERLSQTRNAAYDAARFAAHVISSFRYALKNTMF